MGIFVQNEGKNGRSGKEFPVDKSRAVAQVSMTTYEKQRLTRLAKEHGLSLSAFLRMAANDYIQRNEWE